MSIKTTYKVGDRIGATLGRDETGAIRLLGYGTYDGEFVPEEATSNLARVLRDNGIKCPRARLDSGDVVYACECQWRPETLIREALYGKLVKKVDIKSVRQGLARSERNNVKNSIVRNDEAQGGRYV